MGAAMHTRTRLLIGMIVVGFGLGSWLGWRWWTTPALPSIRMDGVEKEVVDAVDRACREVESEPRSGKSWGELAMVLSINGLENDGIPCFVNAEHLDRNNPRWPYVRGVVLMTSNPAEGIPLIRRSLPLAENDEQRTAIHFRLAMILIEQFQLEEAEQHLEALGRIEPDSARLHFGLGLFAVARDDARASVKHLSTLTDNPFAAKRACSLLLALKEIDRDLAAKCQLRATQLHNDFPWPDVFLTEMNRYKVNLASRMMEISTLQDMGRLQEALRLLGPIARQSMDSDVSSLLAKILIQADQLQDAEMVLRTAIGYDSTDVNAHYRLGWVLFKRGEQGEQNLVGKAEAAELYRQAIAAEEKALKLQGDHGNAQHIRGQALKRLGRMDDALLAFREALSCRPEFIDFHLSLAEALAEANRFPEAIKQLEYAVSLAPPDENRPRKMLEKWQEAGKNK
jgi:tetratricopeptide (TPR) repeat protein